MNTYQIECALAVARLKSFTKAARELNLSQPTLSSQIQKLEDSLGTRLFDRSTVPLRLTYAGEVYLKKAGEIMLLSENLEREIRDIADNKAGRITLGITQGRMPYVLPKVIQYFQEHHPGINICGVVSTRDDICEKIENFSVDFGIYAEYDELESRLGKNIISQDICREELALVSDPRFIRPENLIDGLSSTIDVRTINSIPLIVPARGILLRECLEKVLERHHASLQIALTMDDTISMYRLATEGFAAAIVPKGITQWVKPVRDVSLYSITPYTVNYRLKIIYHRNTYLGAPERELISVIRETLERLT